MPYNNNNNTAPTLHAVESQIEPNPLEREAVDLGVVEVVAAKEAVAAGEVVAARGGFVVAVVVIALEAKGLLLRFLKLADKVENPTAGLGENR